MKIKVKKLVPGAVMPERAHAGDAGFDLVAVSKGYDEYGNLVCGTGLAFEIPSGYVGLVFPRSSISKKICTLANAVGVIDSGYRGEVTLKFKAAGTYTNVAMNDRFMRYEVGERIGQMVIMELPQVEFEESDELGVSDRGDGGFGSTGR